MSEIKKLKERIQRTKVKLVELERLLTMSEAAGIGSPSKRATKAIEREMAIIQLRDTGNSFTSIGVSFGVSPVRIRQIYLKGKRRQSVPSPADG